MKNVCNWSSWAPADPNSFTTKCGMIGVKWCGEEKCPRCGKKIGFGLIDSIIKNASKKK